MATIGHRPAFAQGYGGACRSFSEGGPSAIGALGTLVRFTAVATSTQ